MVASVPELTSRTFSTGATRATISSASSTSPGVAVPYEVPCASASCSGLDHGGMAVAEDHRAPGADQVDVAVAVDVGDVGPLSRGHEARRAADRAERADRGVDATRHDRRGRGRTGPRSSVYGSREPG